MVELAPESFVHPPSSASSACCNNERYFASAGVDGKPDGVRCWENEIYDDVWRFPEMGGPLNHPFDFRIFHSKPSSYWGTPIYGNLHMEMMMGMMGMGFR
jgi:hypothetical protein